jgi:hypothetical protein
MMDAILATIVDSRRAICKITQVAVEINLYDRYFIISYKTKPKCFCPTPSEEVVCVGLGRSIDPTP